MIIRHLVSSDLDDLVALYEHLHRADDPVPERSILESAWEELMSSRRYRYYGGFQNGELVSSCVLTIIPNLTRGCRPYGLIENVVTHVRHRRRGYGKAILNRALAEAWAENCYKVMLMTGRKDDATLRFYRSAGFDANDKQAFIARPNAR